MDHSSPEEIKKHVKLYLLIGLVLIIGTCLTVYIATIDFGSHHLNIGIGLLIAAIKASCVALIFMHLNSESKLIYKILVFAAIFVFGLAFLTLYHDPLVDRFFDNTTPALKSH